MQLPTQDQVLAAGRHVGTAAASIVGTLAAMKLISGGDADTIKTALDQIGHGVAEIAAAVATITTAVMAVYASLSANPLVQLAKGMFNLNRSDPAALKQAIQVAPIEQKAALVQAANEVPSVVRIPLADTKEGQAIAAAVPSAAVDVQP